MMESIINLKLNDGIIEKEFQLDRIEVKIRKTRIPLHLFLQKKKANFRSSSR